MSLRTNAVATVASALLSPRARLVRHGLFELRRRLRGDAPTVVFFYELGDAHSHLLAQTLPELARRYGVTLQMVVVPPQGDAAELRARWSARDCRLLAAERYALSFPQSGPDAIDAATRRRAAAILLRRRPIEARLAAAVDIGEALWSGDDVAFDRLENAFGGVAPERIDALLHEGAEELARRGHYQGAMLYFDGEWYWSVDRLRYLQQRLDQLAFHRSGASHERMPARLGDDERGGSNGSNGDSGEAARPGELEMFFSFRSPYSYLALDRLAALIARYEVTLRVRALLPMVSRGHGMPLNKRLYILDDSAREAERLRVPFGRICDPMGAGVERCLAVLAYADREGRALPFLRAAGRGIWSEAVDVARDRGLRRVVERAGLSWAGARAALRDEAWRDTAEANRAELDELGLWGVPCWRFDDLVTWGQDRMALLERRVRARCAVRA